MNRALPLHVRPLLLALVLPLVAVLAGCGLNGTNDGGYITGDGRVVSYAVDDRGAPVKLAGDLLDGTAFDPSSVDGKVTVVNVWGAWCGACLSEAAFIQEAHEKLGDDVAFLGIDVRDPSAQTAQAFEREHGITYPSIFSTDGAALLGFPRGKVPGSTPSTLVLDTQGRVAAVIRGEVPSTLTLTETVQCVQDPSGQGC
jgi:thiol-disulfide isomerase/thioredoxin